ncbi:hypothetical protein [Demequina salsinemoris]|uniref:hypothetical protein n=1 Tax=Demequina salsinemoris TaxID=577470 RepID=UPI0007852AA4|nr:hypothetical protein [Demequina salsinemoris]
MTLPGGHANLAALPQGHAVLATLAQDLTNVSIANEPGVAFGRWVRPEAVVVPVAQMDTPDRHPPAEARARWAAWTGAPA